MEIKHIVNKNSHVHYIVRGNEEKHRNLKTSHAGKSMKNGHQLTVVENEILFTRIQCDSTSLEVRSAQADSYFENRKNNANNS